MTEERIVQM